MKQDRNWISDELERIHGPMKEWGRPNVSFERTAAIAIALAIGNFLVLIVLTLWH